MELGLDEDGERASPRPYAAAPAMLIALTLSGYIARAFTLAVLAMLAALCGLVALFDFIELLRRSATKPDATFALVAEIAALHMPWEAMEILPFAVLLGGIFAFWRLTRSSELIVARAAGVSAWQFLAAPVLCAVAIGAIATGALSPVSAVMQSRAEALDNTYLHSGGGPLALNGGQLWLRQADRGIVPQGVAILHAMSVKLRGGDLQAKDVSVFRLNNQDHLLERIEATGARLAPKTWILQGARTTTAGHLPDAPQVVAMPTDLTVGRVEESFASPDSFSVWALPGFIAMLERSGFSSIRHRLHFQSLLALPLLAGVAIVVLGVVVTRSQSARAQLGSIVAAVGLLLDAPRAARRRGADAGQRGRRRLRAVPGLQGGGGVRPVRRAAPAARRLGAGRRGAAAVARLVAASGRRVSMSGLNPRAGGA
jgi:lipopolysaccharide export system permease protein